MTVETAAKLYLLDANVIICAHENYYPVDRIQPFWDWLIEEARSGHAKIPLEIYNEISPSENNPLHKWIKDEEVYSELILDEEVDRELLNRVVAQGYAPDLKDDEQEQMGRDPFIVAYALMGPNRAVVTKEVPKPSKKRGDRKLPDVCETMEVPCMNDFKFYRERNFRIP